MVLGEVQKQTEVTEQPTTELTKKVSESVKGTVLGQEKTVLSPVEISKKMNPVFLAALSLFAGINPIVLIVLTLACLIGIFYLLRKKR